MHAEARSLAGGAAYDVRSRPESTEWHKFFGGNLNRDDVWWRYDLIAGDLPSSGNRQYVFLVLCRCEIEFEANTKTSIGYTVTGTQLGFVIALLRTCRW